MLSQILSSLSEISQALARLNSMEAALARLERATAPAGPAGINHDAWLGLRPDSAAAYAKAVKEFAEWAQVHQVPVQYPAEVDRAVVHFAQERKLTRARLENLCAALRRGMPSVKGHLAWAEMHLKHMLKYSPPSHKVPMLRFVAIVVGYTMAIDGFARAGGLLILQACTGLRPGEVLSLRRDDLIASRKNVNNGNAVLALGMKTGTKSGRPQFVVIHAKEDPTAIALVNAFCASTKHGQPLTSLDYNGFSKIFKSTLAKMHLTGLNYTPHSPRAGWATQLRLQGMPFTEIQERGRWASAQTLRTYLDAVAASTTLLQQTHSLHDFAAWLDESFVERFPWWR